MIPQFYREEKFFVSKLFSFTVNEWYFTLNTFDDSFMIDKRHGISASLLYKPSYVKLYG